MFAGTVLADPKVNQKVEERAVFVTGSLIPQRVKLQPIGTTTVSPIRFIDRHEIDWTARQTTPGAFVNEPVGAHNRSLIFHQGVSNAGESPSPLSSRLIGVISFADHSMPVTDNLSAAAFSRAW